MYMIIAYTTLVSTKFLKCHDPKVMKVKDCYLIRPLAITQIETSRSRLR
jgi:hypothetical protein